MRAPPTIEAMKGVTLFYTNPHSGERLDDQNVEYPISDVVRFLLQFTRPGVSLITTMPSGLGLDFHSEDDGAFGLSFMATCFRARLLICPRHRRFWNGHIARLCRQFVSFFLTWFRVGIIDYDGS
jgi:hypothetical protein